MMKITIYTVEQFPTAAGDSRSAFHFATALSSKGIDTNIAYLKKNKSTDRINLKQTKLPFYSHSNFSKILYHFSLPFILISRFCRSSIWLVYGSLAGHKTIILIGRLLGKKVVFRSTLIGYDDLETLTYSSTCPSLNQLIYSSLWGYWALTNEFSDRAKKNFPALNSITFPQGVSDRYFHNYQKKVGPPKIVGIVGHMIKRKGFPEIFEWFQHLDESCTLLVIGDTSKESHLVKVGKEQLGNRVSFTGIVEEVQPYLQKVDIFLHSSTKEGFPNSLAEAMAMGLPCVVKKFVGADTYLQHNINCLIFETKLEFISSIRQLLQSEPECLRLGENAKLDAEKIFRIDQLAEVFLEFIQP